MDKKINAKSVTFSEFENEFTKQYIIPTLQRPYVWEAKKHIKKFLDDVNENDENYFIGSIVVVNSKDGTTGREEIIDGQQRLTTISLILISIRDLIEENNLKNEYEIILREIDSFLKYIDSYDLKEVIRLKFSDEETDSFFNKMIKKDDYKTSTETQKRILVNYNYITDELKKTLLDKNKKINRGELDKYFLKIKSLQAIGITCKDHTNAYELFESINATGLSLASIDLIKNFVFKKLKDQPVLLEKTEVDWQNMEGIFSERRNLLKTFLRHQWISSGQYVSHSALFGKVEDKFKDDVLSISKYVNNLLADARIYFALRNYEIEGLGNLDDLKGFDIKNLKEVLSFLSFLGVDQVYAPILYFYKNKNGHDFIKYLNKLVAFQFLYKYIPGSPSAAERIYASMSDSKGKENENFQKLIKLVDKSKEIFKEKFLEKIKYQGGKSGDVQFILERYVYSKDDSPKASKEPTIEHIISQKENIENKNIHKIGNLTIFERTDNSALPDKISDKIKSYKKSPYPEHQEIVDNYDFVNNYNEAIKKRSDDMADKIYDIFMQMLKTGKIK